MLLVPEDISHKCGLAGSTLSYKDANLVIRHLGRIKLSELKRHPAVFTQNSVWAGARYSEQHKEKRL